MKVKPRIYFLFAPLSFELVETMWKILFVIITLNEIRFSVFK